MSAQFIWFLIGVAFLVAELTTPGFVLIFFAIGAWLTALLDLAYSLNVVVQLVVFVSSSLASLFLFRDYFKRSFGGVEAEEADPGLERFSLERNAVVTKRIAPHMPGEIKFSGSFWRAVSDRTIEEGTPVRVVAQDAGDSLMMVVKPLEGSEND